MSLAFLHSFDGKEPHTEATWGVAWTSTDSVVSISADGTIKHWDSTSGDVLQSLPPHALGLVSLSVPRDGRRVLYNSLEGLTSLWDLETGEVVGRSESCVRSGHDMEPSWSVSLHPNGETYASTGGSASVFIHSAVPQNFGEPISRLQSGRSKFGMCCKHSPDGSKVALSTDTGQTYIFDLESSALSSTSVAHAMAVRSVAWSSNSQLLMSASEDKRLVLHDIRAGGTVASLAGHSSWVLSVDFSPDGRLAVSGSGDKTIKVWELSQRTAVSTIRDTSEVWCVSFRPKPAGGTSSGAFVSGCGDGEVRWWRSAGNV